jgi:hemin uptake protein HemP
LYSGAAGDAGRERPQEPRRVKSADLFCGGATLIIEHAGQMYLLRTTRENKLILTK